MNLLQAVHNGDLDRLKEIIDELGVPTDQKYSDYVLLKYALWRRHRDIAKLLIEKGCRINRLNKCSSNTPLHIAIKQQDIEIINILLDKGACIESINHNGETPLHFAAKTKNDLIIHKVLENINATKSCNQDVENKGGLMPLHIACMRNDLVVVEKLLKSDSSINDPVNLESPFWPSYTPLHFAVEYGRHEIVELLLNHGADISVKNLKSMTPLHLAVQIGSRKIIDLILSAHNKYTENINPMDNEGFTHFHAACMRSNATVVEEFLKRGVEVNSCVSKSSAAYPGYSPLHFAVQYECTAIVELLLKYNADISIKDSIGKTPLHLAITKENREIVDLLLSAYKTCFTDLNPVDDRDFSHFHVACMRNNADIVSFFLKNGVDVNKPVSHLPNWPEYTPLHFAVENRCERTVEVLLKHGAAVEARDAKGMTPLHLSVVYHDDQIAKMLLNSGANVNVKTKTEMTPLHLAVERGSYELVRLLLSNNADVNSIESLKLSVPLHLAALHKNYKIIDLLLTNGADVNARERDGKTALHTMTLRDPKRELDMELVESYSKIIKSLVSSGCNVDSKDMYGRTPLHMTCLYRNLAGAYALLQHGADINIEDNIGKTPLLYCMHVFHNIYYIFQDHIEKLMIINITVSDKNQVCFIKLKGAYKRQKRKWNEMEQDVEFSDQCHEELNRMRDTRIDNYWSLYNILFKNANEMALHVKNDTLTQIVESSDFDKTFPLYGYLIKLQMKRGSARLVLMGPAIESLHYCIGMELPTLCSETILKYLTNDQLNILIKVKV